MLPPFWVSLGICLPSCLGTGSVSGYSWVGLPWQQGSWGKLQWVTQQPPVLLSLLVSTATPSPIKRVCAAAMWACAPSAPSAMPWPQVPCHGVAGYTVYAVQSALSMQCRVHCLWHSVHCLCTRVHCPCAQGALSMCTGGNIYVRWVHYVEPPSLPTHHHHLHPYLLHNPIFAGTCARWVMCTSTLSPPPPSIFLPSHTSQGLYGQAQSTAQITRFYPSIIFNGCKYLFV